MSLQLDIFSIEYVLIPIAFTYTQYWSGTGLDKGHRSIRTLRVFGIRVFTWQKAFNNN